MHKRLVTFAALLTLVSGSAFAAGDPKVGHAKSAPCANCHGASGVSMTDAWPNLAGQGNAYLIKQLKAFRDGTRKDPLMSVQAKAMTDQDIENYAAFYSSIKPGIEVPPVAVAPTALSNEPHAPIMASSVIKVRAHPTRQYWADRLPPGEGHDVIVQKCQLCHDLQRAIAFARPKNQWQEVIESMTARGSPVTPAETTVLVNYLTKNFGPDSPAIKSPDGSIEVGMKTCKESEWPKGASDFRSKWKSAHNIWVSNQQGQNIDIVDPSTKDIVSRINCVNAADRVEFSKDGNWAYAPSRIEHNVTVIDTRTGAIKAKVPVLARPNTSVLSRDFKKLYVGIWPVRGDEGKVGYVQVMDTDSLKIVKTITTAGGIHDTWMSRDGKYLLAMSPFGRFMEVYDVPAGDKLLYTCCREGEIGTMEMEAAEDNSTRAFIISYAGFYGVVAIDPKTGKELTRVKHPDHTDGPFKGVSHRPETGRGGGFHGAEITPDKKTLWVMSQSILYKYELPSLKPQGDVHLATVDQAGKPFRPAVEGTWMTLSPDSQKLYAVRPGRNLLSIVDVKTMKEEALIPTGEYPLHISVWPRGTP